MVIWGDDTLFILDFSLTGVRDIIEFDICRPACRCSGVGNMGAAASTSLQNRLITECGERSPSEATSKELNALYADVLAKSSSSEDAFQAVKQAYLQIPQTKDEAGKAVSGTTLYTMSRKIYLIY